MTPALPTYPYQFLSSSSQRYSTLHLITIKKPFVACNPPQEKHGYGSATPSFNEHLASLDSLPFFISSLPDDPADNVALSALRSLVHDGTPDGLYIVYALPLCYCTVQVVLI